VISCSLLALHIVCIYLLLIFRELLNVNIQAVNVSIMVCWQGVKFMYDCVTGKQIEGSTGCIMADEMVIVISQLLVCC